MVLNILSILGGIYVCGIVLMMGIIGLALWKVNGFQGFADFANRINPARGKPFTSNEVQWMLVTITLIWPFMFVVMRPRKPLRK